MRTTRPIANPILLAGVIGLSLLLSCSFDDRDAGDMGAGAIEPDAASVDDDTPETADDDTAAPPRCTDADGEAPTADNLAPKFSPEYYAEQSRIYFDTLDSYADPDSIPNYSTHVARWEWPPWLKLTGFGREAMILIDKVLRLYPTEVPVRDCRAFETQPFGRCRVEFSYNGGPACPIYEEFTFNDAGEVTFIEAWSDFPPYFPSAPDDPFAENPDVSRLATKIPGLGRADGRIDLDGDCTKQAAQEDTDVADFVRHAKNPIAFYIRDFLDFGAESFESGCGWEIAR
ncbi:hypothetical protein K8I61_12360 [bacterium]|nr:hypothetical protein [bacterium]